MCIQCAAAAATAVGSAAGLRAWLRARAGSWLTARRMRIATLSLAALAVVASGVVLGG